MKPVLLRTAGILAIVLALAVPELASRSDALGTGNTDGTADAVCLHDGLPARLHEANLSYLSLWYTAGRDYALHGGEWKMTGGIEQADSILVASEPLTRDTNAWVEVPEYSMMHAELKNGRPVVTLDYVD